ncbi:hypothetical protein CCL09_23100, partial [Pseudomonas congelans]|uniref:hypothetical protein n=1 Tax=Pseudomonas congelans TaxID=200452 RepID=UPI000BB5D762
NLLMAVFVEAPWAVISTAKPIVIGTYTVGILDKSAAYWKARGNLVWGDAIRGFRGSMVAMGGFGIAAVTLELKDILEDLDAARTIEEKTAISVKGASVFVMGAGSTTQLAAGIFPASTITTIAMSSWLSVVLLMTGFIYLFATMALNYFKQDSIGWWLRRCCWSKTVAYRHLGTAKGEHEEIQALLEIQLSPQVYVKSTVRYEDRYLGKGDHMSVAVQNGAGVQVRLPNLIRGNSLHFNVISSKRPWGLLPVEKIDQPIHDSFLNRGQFRRVEQFKILTNTPAGKASEDFTYPLMPLEDEDLIWETWVPLDKDATYLELQIWYPSNLIHPGEEDRGYLFQIELSTRGDTNSDGLAAVELEVKTLSRTGTLTLEVAESRPL